MEEKGLQVPGLGGPGKSLRAGPRSKGSGPHYNQVLRGLYACPPVVHIAASTCEPPCLRVMYDFHRASLYLLCMIRGLYGGFMASSLTGYLALCKAL